MRVHITNFLYINKNIDAALDWKYKINVVRLKPSKVAAVIYKASCLIDRNGMHVLYCSLFLPYLNVM